jgi:hypothetical protein
MTTGTATDPAGHFELTLSKHMRMISGKALFIPGIREVPPTHSTRRPSLVLISTPLARIIPT